MKVKYVTVENFTAPQQIGTGLQIRTDKGIEARSETRSINIYSKAKEMCIASGLSGYTDENGKFISI